MPTATKKRTTKRVAKKPTTKRKTTTTKKTTARKTTTRKTTAKKTAPKRTTTARKTTAKKTTAKRTTAKKVTAPKKLTAIKTPYKKTEIIRHLAEECDVTRQQATLFLQSLEDLTFRHIKKGSSGVFNLPGMMKVSVTRKKATKDRPGINPFTGEKTTFKGKPARNVVKVRPLKKMKEMVE